MNVLYGDRPLPNSPSKPWEAQELQVVFFIIRACLVLQIHLHGKFGNID